MSGTARPEADAGFESEIYVALLIDKIVVPLGIPAPVTSMPIFKLAVDATWTEVLEPVVSEESV